MKRIGALIVAISCVAGSRPAWSALASDLVAYYRFENNLADTSGSPQVNNGTPVNLPGFTSGKLGRGLSLTGFRDYMTLNPAIHTELDFGSTLDGSAVDFSIAMWVKQTNSSVDAAVLSNKDWDNGANTGINWAVNGDSAPFDLNLKADAGSRQDLDTLANSSKLEISSWNLVVMTVDRDGPTKLYINGSNTGTIPLSSRGGFNSNLPWNVGQDGIGNYGIDFTGAVDELAFWRRALSSQEAAQIWNRGAGTDLFAPQFDDTLRLLVNRESGSMQILNATANYQDIMAYSIVSSDGTLNRSAWTTIRDHYDGSGNQTVDDERWVVFSKGISAYDLSEGSLGVGRIGQGSQINLGVGVWDPYYEEETDLRFEFLDGSGQLVSGIVEFTGGPSMGYPFADLNFDGTISKLDWAILRAGFGTNLVNLSMSQRYRRSDLNGDGEHTLADILVFRQVYDGNYGSGAFSAMASQVPEPQARLLAIGGLSVLVLRNFRITRRVPHVVFAILCIGTFQGRTSAASLFYEDFNKIALGPKVDEGVPGTNVWSAMPPSGWSIDNAGVPAGGVTEWSGWSFADPTWWASTAGDQERSRFTKATGVVAVADPDEWDDLAHDPGTYNTFLKTPPILLAGIAAGTVQLRFDSSWLPEDFQTANLTASYDGGPATELFRWTSEVGSPQFKTGATNETVTVPLRNPAGAQSLVLQFGLFDAGNDWWWAIDNVHVFSPVTLQINVGTGAGILLADPGVDISGYEISSPSGSLNAHGWLAGNLDQQNYGDSQLVGDFDTDSTVASADLTVWSASFALSGAADADGDGDSDGRDFLFWQRHYGSHSTSGEPWLTFLATNTRLVEATLGQSRVLTDLPLGLVYDKVAGSKDLTFEYTTAAGEKVAGNVVYVGSPSLQAVPEPQAFQLTCFVTLLVLFQGRATHES